MKPRKPLSPPLAWLSEFDLLALYQCCLVPLFYMTRDEVRMWLATPTPTPVAMSIDVGTEGDESTTRADFIDWLREQHGLQATSTPDLEERAYYLAGEAPKLRSAQTWPHWYGLRYAVGPASGDWLFYWPGCDLCPPGAACFSLSTAPRQSLATARYLGLNSAAQVSVAVGWRGGQPYFAVVWPGICPTPQPVPTFSSPGPTEPGW
jgi:hypothetical protein